MLSDRQSLRCAVKRKIVNTPTSETIPNLYPHRALNRKNTVIIIIIIIVKIIIMIRTIIMIIMIMMIIMIIMMVKRMITMKVIMIIKKP